MTDDLYEHFQTVAEDTNRVARAIWTGIFPHNGRTYEQFVELKRSYKTIDISDYAPEEMRLKEVVRISEVEVGDLLMITEASGQEKRQYGRIANGMRPWMSAREAINQVYGYRLAVVAGKTAKRLKVVYVQKPGQQYDTNLADLKYASAHMNTPETIDPAAVTRQIVRLGVYADILDRMAEHPDYTFWANTRARAAELEAHYEDEKAIARNRAEEAFAPKKKAAEKLNQLAGEQVVRPSYISDRIEIADWLKTEAHLRTYLLGCMVEREWNEYDIEACASALATLGWNK